MFRLEALQAKSRFLALGMTKIDMPGKQLVSRESRTACPKQVLSLATNSNEGSRPEKRVESGGQRFWVYGLLRLVAFCGEFAQREALVVGEQQADRDDGHEGHEPEHDAATGSEFGRNFEDTVQHRDGGELRAGADAG